MSDLLNLITATESAIRNRSLEEACGLLSGGQLLEESARLDVFRRQSENLYERVRALFFLYAIHRFHLPARLAAESAVAGAAHRSQPDAELDGNEQ